MNEKQVIVLSELKKIRNKMGLEYPLGTIYYFVHSVFHQPKNVSDAYSGLSLGEEIEVMKQFCDWMIEGGAEQ